MDNGKRRPPPPTVSPRPARPGAPPGKSAVGAMLAQVQALSRARNYAAASALCRKILQADPANPDAWHFLGVIAHLEQRYDDAKKLILHALSLSPANPYFRNNLGNVYRALGAFEAAQAAYRQALAQDSGILPARKGLAVCLRAQGDAQGSVAELERLVSLVPKDIDAHAELAISLRGLGRLDAACDQARIMLDLQPGLQRAQRSLAETLLLGGNYREGWQAYLRSLTSAALPEPGASPSPFEQKRVTVYGSEGAGDEIMAAG
jgi:Flp pilus assembly protein TadD